MNPSGCLAIIGDKLGTLRAIAVRQRYKATIQIDTCSLSIRLSCNPAFIFFCTVTNTPTHMAHLKVLNFH